ncbi:hypothetical protein M514_25433 [Trichuris suis]|uniref:Pao retrotransposon peptidase n=1 Tax=Trichuris suis TaxID=68888 RepID=A0A085MYX9_9BILA|nr:hypothetical protein M514_25433 [Trichuris suis]
MQEYIAAGHARKLSPEEVNAGLLGRRWWLPHHPVINPNKPSKLRIVFDAAATFKGVSLNSALLKGPDLTANMTSVLLRFRLYPVAVSSDIIKMFHQVMVQPPDRSALRFVWKEPGYPQPLCHYQMMVQIFGATCSPTICAYTLRKAAMDSGEHADLVMRQVINHFYVDNWLASFRSEAEAAQTVGVVTRALERAGFKLAQWASSRPDALRAVSEESLSSVNVDLDSIPIERTLGLTWDTRKDAFLLCFKVRPGSRTKREVLRTVATIFDPLGFLEPVTLRAKLIVQATWRLKLDWDDPLPIDIQEEWNAWLARCLESPPVIVSRCLIPDAPAFSTVLHVFADASEAGYGTVAYLRVEVGNDIIVSFVMAKSRVGPIKPTTMPRMELNAAVMATRLMNMIKDCLGLNFDRVMFQTVFALLLSTHSIPFTETTVSEVEQCCSDGSVTRINNRKK